MMRQLGIFLLIALAVSVPWLIFRQCLPAENENYLGNLRPAVIAANLGRIPLILKLVFDSVTDATRTDGSRTLAR